MHIDAVPAAKRFLLGPLKSHWANAAIVLIIAFAAALRLSSYGDFRLSIATDDTQSYVGASNAPLFSPSMLTGGRLLTTNLLYRLSGANQCTVRGASYPATEVEGDRKRQPCFSRVAFVQNVLSLIGWAALAGVVAARQRNWFSKLLAALLIPLFGYSPPIADWDSILSSESLTFSLFSLACATLILIAFEQFEHGGGGRSTVKRPLLYIAGLVALAFWAFVRDPNAYAALVLLAIVLPLAFLPSLRKSNDPQPLNGSSGARTLVRALQSALQRSNRFIMIAAAILASLVILCLETSSLSGRWRLPMRHVYGDNILPFPTRVDFLKRFGMPDPNSSAYPEWFNAHGLGAYSRFLAAHPGFVWTSIAGQSSEFFLENAQPYFKEPETAARDQWMTLGDVLHPKSSAVFVIDFILLVALLINALQTPDVRSRIWAGLAGWLFLSATLILIVSFFGDTIGINRHVQFAVEMYRLFLWLFLIVLLDLFLTRNSSPSQPISLQNKGKI